MDAGGTPQGLPSEYSDYVCQATRSGDGTEVQSTLEIIRRQSALNDFDAIALLPNCISGYSQVALWYNDTFEDVTDDGYVVKVTSTALRQCRKT